MISELRSLLQAWKLCFFFFSLAYLFGCSDQSNNYSTKYFSIRNLIYEDTLSYTNQNLNLEKSVLINESDFSIVKVIHPHWEKELKIIADADINRSSWRDKFETDSSFNGNKLSTISYTATDEKLSIRKIEISFSDSTQAIKRIQIQIEKNTLLNSTNTMISYTPDYGYDIFSTQKVILFGEKTFLISGRLKK